MVAETNKNEPKEILVTTYEIINQAEEAKLSSKEREDLEQLDWSLCLLIACTNFGFEELLKQYNQAVRLYCTETQDKIEKIMLDRYPASWRHEMESDYSSANGGEV